MSPRERSPLDPRTAPPFPIAARALLRDAQLRSNVRHATDIIEARRARVVGELRDWEPLRESGRAVREHTFAHLAGYLEQFEDNCTRAGGVVHWARDAAEAQAIVTRLVQQSGSAEVIKIKSMTTEEIGLNDALARAGIRAYETDLAELILQLGHDQPSHIVVPALHKNRAQIRALFRQQMNLPDLGESPQALADAARHFLREKFLRVRTAVGGANFLVAETGSVVVVESEGNGRMCLTLPGTLITVAGIDKVIPRYQDLEVLLQLLPRSATGERMNPYTSVWAGVRVGDGPQSFHVVLLDNGRTDVLADAPARQTLHCIRCGACQNACPVYQQTGGHAYGSVYAGPIGAILTPQLQQMQHGRSLPFASTLCGACYEVCPVKINIPEVLLHLRHRVVAQSSSLSPEALAMRLAGAVFRRERRFRAAQRLARMVQRPLVQADTRDAAGHELKPARPLADELWIRWLPGVLAGWTSRRDLPAIPAQSFREWFQSRSAVSRAENRTDAKPNPASSGEGHRP